MHTYGLQELHFGLQEKTLCRVPHCWFVQGRELYLTILDDAKVMFAGSRIFRVVLIVGLCRVERAIIQPAGREQSALSDPAREPGGSGGAAPL